MVLVTAAHCSAFTMAPPVLLKLRCRILLFTSCFHHAAAAWTSRCHFTRHCRPTTRSFISKHKYCAVSSTRMGKFRRFIGMQSAKDDDNYFDDFADMGADTVGDDRFAKNTPSPAVLREQLQRLQQVEAQQEAQISKNWKTGNWKVRGFMLDSQDAHSRDEEDNIRVNCLTPAAHDHACVWVGRTNGSFLCVQIGTDYLTRFQSKLTASLDDNNSTAKIRSHLAPEELSAEQQNGGQASTPFRIRFQSNAANASTVGTAMLAHDEALYVASGATIQQYHVDDDDNIDLQVLATKTLTAHGDDILKLQLAYDDKLLVSAARDGSVALWDIHTGDLLHRFDVVEVSSGQQGDNAVLTSADANDGYMCVGTRSGRIVVYTFAELLDAAGRVVVDGEPPPALPNGQWVATDGVAVTCIACAGEGTLGRGTSSPTQLLLTGDANGIIQQWEILQRGNRIEQWPKMAKQRLPKKAHVFGQSGNGAITALLPLDATKFLAADADGRICAWHPGTGVELFRMEGLDHDLRSLCLVMEHTLITNGGGKYVFLHDFDVANPGIDSDGFELEEL